MEAIGLIIALTASVLVALNLIACYCCSYPFVKPLAIEYKRRRNVSDMLERVVNKTRIEKQIDIYFGE